MKNEKKGFKVHEKIHMFLDNEKKNCEVLDWVEKTIHLMHD